MSTTQLSGKILLADDEVEIRNLVRIVLTDIGFEVIEAHDGVQALELFHQQKDELVLVILDVMMPGRTGIEVYEEMRAADPNIKAILSSGFHENESVRRIAESKEIHFLKKPYLTRTLQDMVIKMISESN